MSKPNDHLLNPGFLRKHFQYLPDGTLLRIKKEHKFGRVGNVIGGSVTDTGYVKIVLKGKNIKMHRLIFSLVHGYLPEEVDHRNRNRSDNRIHNLRAATKSLNMHNSKKRKENTSGVIGVGFNKALGYWTSRIRIDGKLHTRYSKTKNQAILKIERLKKELLGNWRHV